MHVLLLLASAPALQALHSVSIFEGENAADRFGAALASLGDVDGDAYPDIAVGGHQADPNGSSSGVVRVFSGRSGSELWRLAGDSPFDQLGFSLAGAGDVDGDGVPDLIIGAPAGTPPAGSVLVVSGHSGAVLLEWSGDAPGDRFGQAVASAGDVDGDGCPDVIVGAPHSDAAGVSSGRVRVLSGASGAVLFQRDGAAFDQLGASVAGIGDVNGDGADDVLVGAPFADAAGFNTGSASVLSGADGSVLYTVHGALPGDRLGSVIRRADDRTNDGIAEFLVGIPASDIGAIDAGAVELRSGADGSVVLAVAGLEEGEFLQEGAALGDVNGDGVPDLVVGSPGVGTLHPQSGVVRIHSGATGSVLATFSGRAAGDWFGARLVTVAPIVGDRRDLLVGAPGHDDDLSKEGYAQVLRLQPWPD